MARKNSLFRYDCGESLASRLSFIALVLYLGLKESPNENVTFLNLFGLAICLCDDL